MEPESRRIASLDGLRGVAVLLVVFGHAFGAYGYAQSGVTVFFALSGFLITSVLIRREYSLREFYIRRAKRLLPALVLLVGVFLLVAVVQDWVGLWWEVSWPALTYTASFVASGRGELWYMSHAWSLAVEEHFYLIWPLVFGFFHRHRPRAVMLALAVALAWRVRLNLGDPIRAYYSSDGNAFAILAGCALALAHARRPMCINPIWGSIGLTGLVGLGLVSLSGGQNILRSAAWLPLVSCAIAVLIIAACLGSVQPLLEPRWLRWFGTISYGLYLWHFVLIHMYPRFALLAAVGSVPISAASWYLWERRWLATRGVSQARSEVRIGTARPAMEARPTR